MDSTIPDLQGDKEKTKYPIISNTYKIIDSNFICFNNYVIGSGSFGKVLYSLNVNQTEEYAIKFEKPNIKNSVLEEELTIYKNIYSDKVEGIPKIYWYGEYKKYKIMVMDLLGPSLDKYYKTCNKQFSIDTTVNLGYQMINRIEHVHKMGYVHRDIKPNNFLLGKFNRTCSDDLLYIIDFGLSKDYICSDTGKHYEFSDNKRFVGTPRYASLNTHLGYKQSRRDDIESIIYVLIYFIKGELPWQGVKAKTKSEKKEKIKKKKKSTPVDKLCEGLPLEFAELLTSVKKLEFKQQPDYDLYRKILKEIYDKYKLYYTFIWDWEALFLKGQEYPQLTPTNKIRYEKLYEGYPINDYSVYLDSLIKRYSNISPKTLDNEYLRNNISQQIPVSNATVASSTTNGTATTNMSTTGVGAMFASVNSGPININLISKESVMLNSANFEKKLSTNLDSLTAKHLEDEKPDLDSKAKINNRNYRY